MPPSPPFAPQTLTTSMHLYTWLHHSTLVSHIFLLSLASDSFYETYKYTPVLPILSQCSLESSAFSSLRYPSHPNFQNVATSHLTEIQLAHPIWNLMITSFPHLPHSVEPQPGHFTINAFLNPQLLLPIPSAIVLVQFSPSLAGTRVTFSSTSPLWCSLVVLGWLQLLWSCVFC